MPKVSLIIPAYNAGKYLDATLRSVSSQTFSDFECIIVDDFSNDNTSSVCKAWRVKDRRINLLSLHSRTGVSGARNAGLRMSKGAMIAFLDADDLLMKDSLSSRYFRYVEAVKSARHSSGWIAGSYCASVGISDGLTEPPESKTANTPSIGFVNVGGSCPFNCNQPLIRADVLRSIGGFNEAMSQAEDYDLWARIIRLGYWFVGAPTVSVTYRNSNNSAVSKYPKEHLNNALAIYEFAEAELDDKILAQFPMTLRKRASVYKHQHGKIERVLSFSGMELATANARPVKLIAKDIVESIPDIKRIIDPETSLEKHIVSGIGRQLTSTIPVNKIQEVQDLVLAIEELIDIQEIALEPDSEKGPYGDKTLDRYWKPSEQKKFDILFFPHKDYHVWTIGLFAEALVKSGLSFAVIDLSSHWRDAGVREKACELELTLLPYGEFALGNFAPRLMVTFNDWDYVTRPIMVAAQDAGISTAAIVEGIQDYNDADTGRNRYAYKTVDSVLLPGEFDRRYFDESSLQKLFVTGIPRVQYLRRLERETKDLGLSSHGRVLINSNFSHNVLTEKRDQWLRQAVRAVEDAGYIPVLSRHPEDRGELFLEIESKADFYTTVSTCVASIQRFSSGVLEALAVGVPVIYFNPHGEKVDKFTHDPMGAFPIACDNKSLKQLLVSLPEWAAQSIECSGAFLDSHSGKLEKKSDEITANVLNNLCLEPATPETWIRFKNNLKLIDRATMSLTRRENIFPEPTTAVAKMKKMALKDEGEQKKWATPNTFKPKLRTPRTTLSWKLRLFMHERLRLLYVASGRFPWLHNRVRKIGELYIKWISPI